MAEAIVEQARKRLSEIAPHQYASGKAQAATVEFRIAINEMLSHLRSALDYCARGIHVRFVGGPPPQRIYFPICDRHFKKEDFRARENGDIPGIKDHSKVLDLLESFQYFADPANNGWLPDFATLCNECKHEQLAVQDRVSVKVTIGPEHEGRPVYTCHRSDTAPIQPGFIIHFNKPDKVLTLTGGYFRFVKIDYEVSSFLQTAIDGTAAIVLHLKACV
jgi:hypothetical protein